MYIYIYICMYIFIYTYITTKFQTEHWDQNYNAKVFRPEHHIPGQAQKFPPGNRNVKEIVYYLRGPGLKKRNSNKIMLRVANYVRYVRNFRFVKTLWAHFTQA